MLPVTSCRGEFEGDGATGSYMPGKQSISRAESTQLSTQLSKKQMIKRKKNAIIKHRIKYGSSKMECRWSVPFVLLSANYRSCKPLYRFYGFQSIPQLAPLGSPHDVLFGNSCSRVSIYDSFSRGIVFLTFLKERRDELF